MRTKQLISLLCVAAVISVFIPRIEKSSYAEEQTETGIETCSDIAYGKDNGEFVDELTDDSDIYKDIDLSKLDVMYITGEKSGAQYRDTAGTVSNLYDDDLTTIVSTPSKVITAFDLSEYADKITRIEYSINSPNMGGANFLYGSAVVDEDTSAGAASSVDWETIYRTNGIKASEVNINSSTIDTDAGTGTAVLTGDFSKWNYIGVANGSASCGCSELRIYISDSSSGEDPDDKPLTDEETYVYSTVNASDISVKSDGSTVSGKAGTISGHQLNYADGSENIYLYIPGIDASKLRAVRACYGYNGTSAPTFNYYAADSVLSEVSEGSVSGKQPFASITASKSSQWDFLYYRLDSSGAEFITEEEGITVTLKESSASDISFETETQASNGIIIEFITNGTDTIYFDAFRFEYAYEAEDRHDIISSNIFVPDYSYTGKTVEFELPEGYVENSLVVTYNDGNTVPVELVSDEENEALYSFTMPDHDVSISCLVNTDSSKIVVVGNNGSYFARHDNDMKVSFDVPAIDLSQKYTSAEVYVPVRTHANNALDMAATMNGVSFDVDKGNVSGTLGEDAISSGTNTLTITNENTAGVDYFHNSSGHYPATTADLSVMTLYTDSVDVRVSAVIADGERYEYDSVLPSGRAVQGVVIETNNGFDITRANVYTALYKDQALMSVRKNTASDMQESENNEYVITLEEPVSIPEIEESGYVMKIYIWDDEMIPCASAFTAKTLKITDADDFERSTMSLWYDEPAAEDGSKSWSSYTATNDQNDESHLVWKMKALPIGNGYMGAMIFGGVAQERIQLNEKTLWEGKPNHITEDRSGIFNEARELMISGDSDGSYEKIKQLWGSSSNYGTYTSFGNLALEFTNIEGGTQYSNYTRWLDLDNSIQGVKYDVDGVTYTREYFASYPDRVMAVKLSSNAEDNISFRMTFTNQPNRSYDMTSIFEDNTLKVTGKLSNNDLRWSGEYKIINNGGNVSYQNGTVTVSNADDVVILMTMATDYKFSEADGYRTGVDPSEVTSAIMAAAEGKSFDELYETHVRDYRSIYDNTSLNIASDNSIPTDELRGGYAETNTGEQDRMLDQLFYQYGRYMLISSSREGSLPANLQGVWADQQHPKWESDYHININLQMNYYPAANGNMIECMTPLLDWVEQTMVTGSQTARNVYGCDGWVSHTCNNAFGFTDPGWGDWGIAPESAAWICLNLWDMYEYTQGTEYLPRIYNVIQEAVKFYNDYMYYDETTDTYMSGPSYSPENGPMTMGVKITQQLVKQLYTIYTEATALEFEPLAGTIKGEAMDNVNEQLPKLAEPVEIGQWGNVKEWAEYQGAALEEDSSHKHISHLMALHPCNQITRRTPELLRAARTTLNARGDGSTGWSRAFKTLLWARAIGMDDDAESTPRGDRYVQHVSNGDRAYSIYQGQVKETLFDNLWDWHQGSDESAVEGIFQIDGNFGSTAAMGEFLMQSHDGYIDILPSLPTAWSESGCVEGLLAKGAFEVDIRWADARPTETIIRSNAGGVCRIYLNGTYGPMSVCTDGETVECRTVTEDGLTILEFDTVEGTEYYISYENISASAE